ncbi:MAG: LysM peptidoglycan-binding domain-containing protein [Pontiellaceae bacterium]|nr:LysM peptidoglycan-binding domain-containing protein [Pontiellaceae bacterium]
MMKKNVAVVGAHVAVLGAVSLLSGCFTSNPDSGLIGAAARNRGPIKHVHPGKDSMQMDNVIPPYTGGDLTPFPGGGLEGTEIQTGGFDGGLYTPPDDIKDVPPPAKQYDTYIVQPGDILSRIAVKYDTRTSTLVALNNLPNADVIYVGQKLKVPTGSGSAGGGMTTNPLKDTVKKGDVYEIVPGDTLSDIAVRAGVSIDDLRQLNNISGDMIRAGDKLIIPEGGKISSTSPKKAVTGGGTTGGTEPPLIVDPPLVTNNGGSDDFAGYRIERTEVYGVDTLDSLADFYGAKPADILKANNLTDESQIVKGMELRIPIKD